MELPKPVTARDCFNDCESKICVLSDWSDWSECPQDSCVNGSVFELLLNIKMYEKQMSIQQYFNNKIF